MHKNLLNLLYKKNFVKMRVRVKNARRWKTDSVTCATTSVNQNGECSVLFRPEYIPSSCLFLQFDYTAVGSLADYDCYPH